MTNTLNKLLTAIMNRRRERATFRALSELSDHALKDIGIHRSEIHSFAVEQASQSETSRIRTVRSVAPAIENASAAEASSGDDTWKIAA